MTKRKLNFEPVDGKKINPVDVTGDFTEAVWRLMDLANSMSTSKLACRLLLSEASKTYEGLMASLEKKS